MMMTRKHFKFYTEEIAPMLRPKMAERFYQTVKNFYKRGYLNEEKFIQISGLNWSAECEANKDDFVKPYPLTAKEIEQSNKELEGVKDGTYTKAA